MSGFRYELPTAFPAERCDKCPEPAAYYRPSGSRVLAYCVQHATRRQPAYTPRNGPVRTRPVGQK